MVRRVLKQVRIISVVCMGMGILQACVGQDPVQTVVAGAGLQSGIFETAHFRHKYFANGETGSTLFVYIGSDGTPWINGNYISKDPTPRNPLGLRLMALDDSPAIYLGRPCYFGLSRFDECSSDLWTWGRYSETVIESMEQALLAAFSQSEAEDMVLVGYSGGSVIATLLANRVESVRGLVTVAGNLDIALWVEERGFLPLESSINPADLQVLRSALIGVHLVGGRDEVVPPSVSYSFVEKHGGEFWSYPNFDHGCCWETEWPKILVRVRSLLAVQI